MSYLARASGAAKRVLASSNTARVPVDVKALASKWAHIVEQPLDSDISGMLVPLGSSGGKKKWAIVVNAEHPEVRQRFTVAHELGHLILHGYTTAHADCSFKVRLRNSQSSEGSVREEIEANRFAAELLMPEELLRERLTKCAIEYAPTEENSLELSKLAKKFGVSSQALSIRLSTLLT